MARVLVFLIAGATKAEKTEEREKTLMQQISVKKKKMIKFYLSDSRRVGKKVHVAWAGLEISLCLPENCSWKHGRLAKKGEVGGWTLPSL